MRLGAWVVAGLVVGGCRSGEVVPPPVGAAPSPEPAADVPHPIPPGEPEQSPSAPPPSWPRPPVDDPGVPEIDRSVLLDAPEPYEHVTLRAGLPVAARYGDLVYEGNNKNFRGKPDGLGLYRPGTEAAEDWRQWTAGVKGMIVLRDSLFSQQDHPVLQTPRALMMPPSWVAVAVAVTMRGETLEAPVAPVLDDDEGWTRVGSAEARFGSFPPSQRLFTESKRSLARAERSPGEHARTRNARASIIALGAAAEAMVVAQQQGPEAVAEAGAAWIAGSDITYFGAELRRRIIPIFVENPNEHEARDEGKGMGVWGVELPEDAVTLARDVVYARRLEDGPLGVERYDLRQPGEQQRAITLLETLVPKGSHGHPVWLWVNGGSDGHGEGEPAIPHLPAFETALASADVERSRLVLLSKPSVRPRGKDAQAGFDAYAEQTRDLGIPASVQLNTRAARRFLGG